MTALDQYAPYQQAAVTAGRVFLAAQQRHPEIRHAPFQPLDSAE